MMVHVDAVRGSLGEHFRREARGRCDRRRSGAAGQHLTAAHTSPDAATTIRGQTMLR
jgi:hypothetical protein